MGVTADQIVEQLARRRILPAGAIWRTKVGRALYRVLHADADELARVYGRAEDLLAEAHAATIDESLDEWENELGLPGDCITDEQTNDQRMAAIAAKLRAVGGQSRQYYIDVAAGLGVVITIAEQQPFYVGLHGCGDAVGEIDWKFVWIVTAPPEGSIEYLTCDVAVAGDPLASGGGSPLLECTLQGLKPAQTILLFAYTGG